MKRENIEKVQDAMSAIGDAFYLAYNKDDDSQLNGLYEKRVSEAFEKLQPLRGRIFEIRDFVDYSLRNEIAENLLTYPNDRAFVMNETIWALFAPFAGNTFHGQKTIDIVIFSYGKKVLKCSLLDVWDSNFNVSESEPMAYLSSVNNMALLIIEALQDVVEKGSFDAYKDGEQPTKNSNEAKTKQEKSQQLPGLSKTNGQGDKQNEHSEIDKEALKNLFGNAVFFANDYKERDTLNEKINLSRFDIFVEELESLLNDEHCNQTKIGNVAYMVHKSRFRKYIKFAPTCRLLFECCQLKAPKDQHANKYKHPDSDILQNFSDVLGNPVNPQK